MNYLINGLLTMLGLGILSLACFGASLLMRRLHLSNRTQTLLTWAAILAGTVAFLFLAGGSFEPFSEDRYRR